MSLELQTKGERQLVLTLLRRLCSNDAYDAATGVDKTKKESIVNLTGGNASPVLAVAMACLAAGAYFLWRGIAAAVWRFDLYPKQIVHSLFGIV